MLQWRRMRGGDTKAARRSSSSRRQEQRAVAAEAGLDTPSSKGSVRVGVAVPGRIACGAIAQHTLGRRSNHGVPSAPSPAHHRPAAIRGARTLTSARRDTDGRQCSGGSSTSATVPSTSLHLCRAFMCLHKPDCRIFTLLAHCVAVRVSAARAEWESSIRCAFSGCCRERMRDGPQNSSEHLAGTRRDDAGFMFRRAVRD